MISNKKVNLKLLFSLCFFMQCTFSIYGQPNRLTSRLDSLLSTEYFTKTQIAVNTFDLTNKKQLFNRNDKQLFRPASVQKLFTTSAAFKFLEDDFQFTTSVYHTGSLEDSVCFGDLFVVGGLDPDFSQKDLDSMVMEIKKYGIKEIKGNLYADVSILDSLFWGEGWMWDDDPSSFAAYLSALNINDNSLQVVVEPGSIGSKAKVKIIPENNFINVNNFTNTIDKGKSNFSVTRDWINRDNTVFVKGDILFTAKSDTFSLNVFNPKMYFMNLFKESLIRNGIIFNGIIDTLTATNDIEQIFSIERNIDSVIVNTNKTSDNLSAEMLLRVIALKNLLKPASAKNGIVFVDSLITLSGFNPKDYKLVDGSGLSFYNLISAELVTGILKHIYFEEEKIFVRLFNSLPIAGYDGTLKNRFINSSAKKRVRAKTGTLSGASNLAGYLQSKQGNMLAFAILVQNFSGSASEARKIQDKICELLFEEL